VAYTFPGAYNGMFVTTGMMRGQSERQTRWRNLQNLVNRAKQSGKLDDWEKVAQLSKEDQAWLSGGNANNMAFNSWRGGQLSPQLYSQVSYLEQQEAEAKAKTAEDEAKTANETRYADILKGYDKTYADVTQGYNDRYGQAMQMLQGMGDAERTDLRKTYAGLNASSMQSLVNSGMAGSTVAPSVRAHNTRRLNTAMGQLNDRLRSQQVGYHTSMTGQRLAAQTGLQTQKYGVMERRNDTYPQSYAFAKLMNQYGNYS